jgi:hypothetical protein
MTDLVAMADTELEGADDQLLGLRIASVLVVFPPRNLNIRTQRLQVIMHFLECNPRPPLS